MPQDIPATVAGTDARPPRTQRSAADLDNDIGTPDHWAPVNLRTMRDDVDRFRNERVQVPRTFPDALELTRLALEYYEHAAEVFTRTTNALAVFDLDTDEIRERCIEGVMSNEHGVGVMDHPSSRYTGGRFSKSRTGAKELADLSPAMVEHLAERQRLAAKKAEAEKEMGVARRRHATAITFAHAFTFASPDALADPNTVAGADSIARPDVTAGDTDGGTLAEAQ